MESCLRITNELFDDQENSGEVVSSATLRNEAEKWSLKGDLNLLCTLENFSQDLATKSETMQTNLDQVTYDSKMKAVKVKNLINDFQMLENCQFIENRVYDEEVEDVIVNGAMGSSDEQTKSDDQEKVKQNIKKSLDAGFRFLEKSLNGFRQVNEMSFDSEEEEDCISANLAAMLKENRFNKTPLPHIVGSEMFMKDTFFIASPENGTVETVESDVRDSYGEKRNDEEYFSDASSFDHETFAQPKENHIKESNDDGIFAYNGEAVSNEKPLFESLGDRTKKSTNENVYNRSDTNIPETSKDPFFEAIHDESDEDDDLFGKLKKNQRPPSEPKATTRKVSSESRKLFDDLDDGDLFDIHNQTSKPDKRISTSKPKSHGQVNDNEVNAIDDDFDTLNNSNFKNRLSSILGGQPPKKNPPEKIVSTENNHESIEESSTTRTPEGDSFKTKKTTYNEPLRVESDDDSDDDLFGSKSSSKSTSKSTSRPSSAPKSTARKLSTEGKKLFSDVDDLDFSKGSRKNSKLSIFDDEENDDLFGATKKSGKNPSKPVEVSTDSKLGNKSIEIGVKLAGDLFAETDDDDLFSITNKASKQHVSITKSKPSTQVSNPNDLETNEVENRVTSSNSDFKDRLNTILGGQQKKKSPPQKNIAADSCEEPFLESTAERANKYKSTNEKVSIKNCDIISEASKDTFLEPVCDENGADSEDDLFDKFLKRPQRPPLTTNTTTKKLSSETKNLFDDFDDEDDEDDEDSDSSPKALQKNSKLNIFADNENDDLFGISSKNARSGSTRTASVDTSTSSKPTELGVKLAGDLFAEMDDGDLFSVPKKDSKQPSLVTSPKPMSLNPVSNSNHVKSSVDNCSTLNNEMFKDRAKLGAQRRKRNPTRRNTSAIPAVDSEKPFVESFEEPAITSAEESVCSKSDSIVRETSKDTFRKSLFDESEGDSEDDLFGKSTKTTNRPSSASKSNTTTRRQSLESKKLFDDLDDNLFNQSSKVRRDSKLKMFAGDDENDDLFSTNSKSEKPRVTLADPLFDDDDDLFSHK